MRGRMALWTAGITVELREVKLANKPPELIEASPKATVPVLVLDDGTVIDESIAVARWALTGNAFWRVLAELGEPAALLPLYPELVSLDPWSWQFKDIGGCVIVIQLSN